MIIDYKAAVWNSIVVSFTSALEIKHFLIFIETAETEPMI